MNNLLKLKKQKILIITIIVISFFLCYYLSKLSIINRATKSHFLFSEKIEQLDYISARNHIDQALQKAPKNPVYWANYGLLLERMAIDTFSIVNLIKNSGKIPHMNITLIKEACRAYENAIRINKYDDHFYHNYAWLNYYLENYEKAFELISHANDIDPHNPINMITKGMFHEFNNERDKAMEYYAEAIFQSPEILDSNFFKQLKSRLPDESEKIIILGIKYFKSKLNIDTNPIDKVKLGKFLLNNNSYTAAETFFLSGLIELENLNRPWLYLGQIYQSRGELYLAENVYKKSYYLDMRDYLPYLKLGDIYFKKNNNKCVDFYMDAVEKYYHSNTEHSNKVSRIYLENTNNKFKPGILEDDLIPKGLLGYCEPSINIYEIIERINSFADFNELAIKRKINKMKLIENCPSMISNESKK